MKSNKKLILFIIVGILVVGAVVIGIHFMQPSRSEQVVSKTNSSPVISVVDITKVPQGTHQGSYELDGISVRVSVDVMDGKMNNIQILSHQKDMNETANTMLKDMVEQQKIDVDVVSSATTSNTLIKKAIENALQK